MHKILFGVICMVVCSSLGFTEFSKDDAGTCAAQFLKLGAGARPAGMGGAFVGISDDSTAVYWNPAGLTQVKEKQVSLMQGFGLADTLYSWTSAALPVKFCVLGLGVQYLSYGGIIETDEAGVEKGTFSPNDLAVIVSLAKEISGISLGLNLKSISSKIKASADASAVDIGAMYKLTDDRASFGLVIQNIGTKMKFVSQEESLPVVLKIGGAYRIKNNLQAAVEIDAPQDSEMNLRIGGEYIHMFNDKMKIAGRLGFNNTGGEAGIALGVGVWYGDYKFDFSFVPSEAMGDSVKISAGIKF